MFCPACSAILPIPSAFAVTGATTGTLFLAFVALTNVYTCKLLLRGAVTTGAVDYEGLSYAVGGYPLKVIHTLFVMCCACLSAVWCLSGLRPPFCLCRRYWAHCLVFGPASSELFPGSAAFLRGLDHDLAAGDQHGCADPAG